MPRRPDHQLIQVASRVGISHDRWQWTVQHRKGTEWRPLYHATDKYVLMILLIRAGAGRKPSWRATQSIRAGPIGTRKITVDPSATGPERLTTSTRSQGGFSRLNAPGRRCQSYSSCAGTSRVDLAMKWLAAMAQG